jgi:hypothetical protein
MFGCLTGGLLGYERDAALTSVIIRSCTHTKMYRSEKANRLNHD